MSQVNLGIQLTFNTNNSQGWKLGSESERVTDKDLHKAVVLDKTKEGTMKLAADGEEIRGFIHAIEPHPADGVTFGTVVRHAPGVRYWVTGSGLAVGDMVVSGTQAAVGTANALLKSPMDSFGLTVVKKGTPATYKWEVIRVRGTNQYLIEAI